MTQEEKAKAYDEAYKYDGASIMFSQSLKEEMFLELKEPEDEKIRESLLEYLHTLPNHYAHSGVCAPEWIAWLEKRSKIVDYYEDRLDECACKYFNKGYKQSLEKQGEQDMILLDKMIKFLDDQLVNDKDEVTGEPFINFKNYCTFKESFISYFKRKMLEKQGEQKTANKVEPKFKVGDWVVNNERKNIIKVVNPTPIVYEVVDILGYHHTITDTAIENNYHLWTIQDAKDGDVLVSEKGNPFMFKGTDTKRDNCPIAYFGIDTAGEFCISARDVWWTDKVGCKPATKEQRDLLFSKMKNAGYKWNAEKKRVEEDYARVSKL